MIDLLKVDSANRFLDQMTDDFRLDELEPTKEECTERQAEYSQIAEYLISVDMEVLEVVKVSAKLMDAWNERNDAYFYELGTHNTYLLYKGYCITNQAGQWMFEFEENAEVFFDADLFKGLQVIDNTAGKS